MDATDFAYAAMIVVASASVAALWYSQHALTRATAMLKTAGDYYRRSSELLAAIDAAPDGHITEEALRKMEAFLDEETDQTGSIASDYRA